MTRVRQREAQRVQAQVLAGIEREHGAVVPAGIVGEGHRDAVRRVIAREHGLFTERLHSPEVQASVAAMSSRSKVPT